MAVPTKERKKIEGFVIAFLFLGENEKQYVLENNKKGHRRSTVFSRDV